MSYATDKAELLARIAELEAEIADTNPEQHTARLKAEMTEAAAAGADDEQLAKLAQAVKLAALGADENGTRHAIAASRKQAAEEKLAELEAAEAERIKQERARQIEKLAAMLPSVKAAYVEAYRAALKAHCDLAAVLNRQDTIAHALRGGKGVTNPTGPAGTFALPVPFMGERVISSAEVSCNFQDAIHRDTFTLALAELDAALEGAAA